MSSFFPLADYGSLLIITRLSSLREIATSTEVGRLNLEQALELLCTRSDLKRSSKGITYLITSLSKYEVERIVVVLAMEYYGGKCDYVSGALAPIT